MTGHDVIPTYCKQVELLCWSLYEISPFVNFDQNQKYLRICAWRHCIILTRDDVNQLANVKYAEDDTYLSLNHLI